MTNGNGTGVDLTGPLAGMWRDVYRKAGEVADARAREQLKYHVYTYPHGAGGGGGEDTGPWVDEAGDTMTGSLHFAGPDATVGGAVVVHGVESTAGHLYGPDSPPYASEYAMAADDEHGVRFAVAAARYLVALRWWRSEAGLALPAAVRLWDAADTSAPLAVWTSYPAFTDPALGWKEHPLPPAEQVALLPAHTYALSFTPGSNAQQGDLAYTPVPVAGLTFLGFHTNPTAGQYPATASANGTSLDGDFRESVAADPAASGAIRLPNGPLGTIAWRNAANTGDHTLTVNTADELVFDGVPLTGGGGTGNTTMYTQTGAPTGATNSLWFNPSESA